MMSTLSEYYRYRADVEYLISIEIRHFGCLAGSRHHYQVLKFAFIHDKLPTTEIHSSPYSLVYKLQSSCRWTMGKSEAWWVVAVLIGLRVLLFPFLLLLAYYFSRSVVSVVTPDSIIFVKFKWKLSHKQFIYSTSTIIYEEIGKERTRKWQQNGMKMETEKEIKTVTNSLLTRFDGKMKVVNKHLD